LLPELGRRQVGSITKADVRTFLAAIPSASTRLAVRKPPRLIFAMAVEAGAIKVNPADGIRLPGARSVDPVFLTMEQVVALSDAMGRPSSGLLIRFAALTGLRAGEIGALRVKHIDLHRGAVDVTGSVTEVEGHGLVFSDPKTHERRSVPIPLALGDELDVHLGEFRHGPEEFVFTAPEGGVLRHRNFLRREFRPAVTLSGLPAGLRFHDLRHTYASLLINGDPPAHPLAVMKRMGHSSITVTYDR
jgi:integrase